MAENNFRIQHDDEQAEELLNEHVHEPGDPDGLVAADRQQQWRESHPAPPVTPPAVARTKRRWPVILAILALLAAATFGAYRLGGGTAKKQQDGAKKTTAAGSKTQSTAGQSAAVPTKHYDSPDFTLGFDYPQNWTVTDSKTKLTVTSPAVSLMTAVGSKADVHVVLTIQNQQTTVPGFPAGGAVAALESAKLAYKQPSPIQRAQTYLSFLSYTGANGLDALYVTGDNGYQQGQQVPLSDVVKGNPLISVGFERCTAGDCSIGTQDPVTLQADGWQGSAAARDTNSLIESIVLEGS